MNKIWSKERCQRRADMINNMIKAAKDDFDRCITQAPDTESRNLVRALREGVIAALMELREKARKGLIIPDLPLRLAISDPPVKVPPPPGPERKWRVGFMATTGDPVHWGHILTALRCATELDLNTVILQVMGDHPHKRYQKQPKEHRHAIARLAVEYFWPLLRYTPLGFDNLKVGEENAAEFLLLNCDIPIDLYFLAGSDVGPAAIRLIEACNTILSVVKDELGIELKIKLVLGRRSEKLRLERTTSNVIIRKRKYPELPRINGKPVSSTLFREFHKVRQEVQRTTGVMNIPYLPILPSRALDYIRQHNLYVEKR